MIRLLPMPGALVPPLTLLLPASTKVSALAAQAAYQLTLMDSAKYPPTSRVQFFKS